MKKRLTTSTALSPTLQSLNNTVQFPPELLPAAVMPEVDAPPKMQVAVYVDSATLKLYDPGKYLLPSELKEMGTCQAVGCGTEYIRGVGVSYEAGWHVDGEKRYGLAHFCSFRCLLNALHVEHRMQ